MVFCVLSVFRYLALDDDDPEDLVLSLGLQLLGHLRGAVGELARGEHVQGPTEDLARVEIVPAKLALLEGTKKGKHVKRGPMHLLFWYLSAVGEKKRA